MSIIQSRGVMTAAAFTLLLSNHSASAQSAQEVVYTVRTAPNPDVVTPDACDDVAHNITSISGFDLFSVKPDSNTGQVKDPFWKKVGTVISCSDFSDLSNIPTTLFIRIDDLSLRASGSGQLHVFNVPEAGTGYLSFPLPITSAPDHVLGGLLVSNTFLTGPSYPELQVNVGSYTSIRLFVSVP